MAPHSFTVFVASNRGEKAWRFRLSTSWLKAVGCCAFVLVLFVVTAIVDYAGLSSKAREHEALVR